MPDLSHETRHHPHIVCGIDEAGRGPWAGAVVASCVIVGDAPQSLLLALDDSKKLTRAKRESLFDAIHAHMQVGIGQSSADEIDHLNIWKATERAMQRAFSALGAKADIALIDGNRHPALPCETITLVKGDSISASIAAASIIAKVTRDRMMETLDKEYPGYGFTKHAGYGTRQHMEALKQLGICPAHRKSFAPIRTIIEQAA